MKVDFQKLKNESKTSLWRKKTMKSGIVNTAFSILYINFGKFRDICNGTGKKNLKIKKFNIPFSHTIF